ncbi:MAG: ACP S-malonyltransferase [Opitutales bacterium]|nr:ACP S-malonyltransferase [Opitutales bacterium]
MSIGLLFSGQGAQSVGMGKSLCDNSAAAKAVYESADKALGWSISELSFNGPDTALTQTRVCQPALFVQGMAIVAALEEAGRLPEVGVALGLSLGELTALTYAGAFSLEDGLRTVAERGRLMQMACEATNGTMVSLIGGSVELVKELCAAHDVDMANLNCPGQIVISGDRDNCLKAAEAAKAGGAFKMVVPLNVAGAYHSRLMKSAAVEFDKFLAGIEVKTPRVPVFSNVTGGVHTSPESIRENLVKQVTSSVLWEDDMRGAASMGIGEYIECGPGKVLAGLAKRTDRALKVTSVSEWAELEALPVIA